MASSEDKNFSCSVDSASCRGRSKAQMSVSKILDTISAAVAAAAPPDSQTNLHQDEGERLVGRNVEKKGLLDIDLNVAPPEDGDFESPAAESCGKGQEIWPTAAAHVASVNKVGSVNESGLNFGGDCENRNGIQAHLSQGENNGFDVVGNGGKEMKTTNKTADSEAEMEEKVRRNRGWKTLLEVAENALREHEENRRNRDENTENRKRRASPEAKLGGGSTRKKITGPRRQSFAAGWDDETEVAAAAPVVVRSTRGRAVAMPNKYRDSVLDAVTVAEAELTRHNKSGGKSATVVSTKRKFR